LKPFAGVAATALLALSTVGATAEPAAADLCPAPRPPGCHFAECEVGFVKCGPKKPKEPRGGGSTVHPGHPPILLYIPACSGNAPGGGDELCSASLRTCPRVDEVRFFVYARNWDGHDYGAPVLRTVPATVCLAPEEAAARADPTVAVAALVRAQWQSFGLPGARVQTQPGGETLVGAVTRFSTSTPSSTTLPPKPVLGLDVRLSIKASRYVWDFGDGTALEAAADGVPPRAEHTYRSAGPVAVTLRTYYTATFTIEGSDVVYPLDGTADVPGQPTPITAREARTQLEAG